MTSLPAHLRPVLHYMVQWDMDGEEHRKPFEFKSQALAFIAELEADQLIGKLWQV